MSWFRRRKHTEDAPGGGWRQPSLEEVSAALQNSLERVGEAVRKCEAAEGTGLAVARRELAGELRESMSAMENLVRDVAPSSRLHRMARLTAGELVRMARPWLIFESAATERSSLRTGEMSELQRTMWSRAEEVIAAGVDDPVAARETLHQLIDETSVFSSTLVNPPMSERQALMWRLVVEEIAGLAADALARGSGQPEPH